MSETIHVQGEGGGVFEMSLPLHPAIQARFDAREIVRVNADGSPYTGEAPAPAKRRKAAAEDPAGD